MDGSPAKAGHKEAASKDWADRAPGVLQHGEIKGTREKERGRMALRRDMETVAGKDWDL